MLSYERQRSLRLRYAQALGRATFPLVAAELCSPRVPVAHRPSGREARALVRRIRGVARSLPSATSTHEHLLLLRGALLLEPHVEGVIVECGCWKGSSTSTLSIAAERTGRELHVFDTFAGLPEVDAEDERHVLVDRPEVHTYAQGMFEGRLDEVKANVTRLGEISRCEFHPGRVQDTLPAFDRPVVMAFLDLDLRDAVEASLISLWPRLADGSTLFVHEASHREIASLFYDAAWWQDRLGTTAPGLAGAGSGVGLEFMDGFWRSSIGFTTKSPDLTGYFVRPPVDIV